MKNFFFYGRNKHVNIKFHLYIYIYIYIYTHGIMVGVVVDSGKNGLLLLEFCENFCLL